MIREPAELSVGDDGQVVLPLGLLAEAGLDAGSRLLAFSDGDGRIVLQREADAVERLLGEGTL
ncbi:AbrB/MazE/SpoVT family DNA-binding domain-containing protein [Streptomyces sp. NPDC058193]|uniref:AbrB/MazE/SpoVT family DNA-binding domain-containing protein n=1 Tax=Streptomyces sp. NPDC058193 TaxID=3346373 RepID=UPI0036E98B31